jgi:hypothetical protein
MIRDGGSVAAAELVAARAVASRRRPARLRRAMLLGWIAASTGGCASAGAVAPPSPARLVPVGLGWAQSSVNAPVFRQNSVVSHGDEQYLAYYDADGHLVLAKRRLGTDRWELNRTAHVGNVRDAHNAISIGVDGGGYLHAAWDHHGQPLRYARGTAPGSLELAEPRPMTGRNENAVTYPQFYDLAGGDLLFLYRDGGSGRGNVLLNRYDAARREWRAVQHPLIDGEGERNAYVNQLAIDELGGWHLSWIWRETPDVATNHDVAYAYSPDEGRSWRTSRGEPYALPITEATAEVVWRVPQGHELINQTSMTLDAEGRPLIASYWRPAGSEVPQFHLVRFDGSRWHASQVGERRAPFRLSGGGTKRIPISRPQVVAGARGEVYVIFRDEERGGGVSVAVSREAARTDWSVFDLHPAPVGLWEPTYDPVLWRRERRLHLFHQHVGQGDGETLEDVPPQMVSVLEWTP